MSLKTFVVASTISNLSDARYCAAMGVDLIGFNVNPASENFVTPEAFKEISDWLSGVSFIGEYDGASSEQIAEALGNYAVSYLQVSRPELINDLMYVQQPIILKLDIEKDTTQASVEAVMNEYSHLIEFFILESTTLSAMPSWVSELTSSYPVVIGFGIDKDNILNTVENLEPKGIAIKGSEEIKPGFKDYDEIADVLELLEEE